MGRDTGIQWTDATVNFWTGCKKVSAGCRACYMYRDMERWGKDPTTVLRTSDKTFNAALHWKEPRKIFTCSWSDFFIEEADAWREDAWRVIKATPQHSWQILTKRPERVLKCLPDDWGDGYPNVWIGVSVENQDMADLRIPQLLKIPAVVRFLSCEPLLGPIKLNLDDSYGMIHWVIVGGESGNSGKYKYRPCKIEWITDIARQSFMLVPCFVKQLGTDLAKQHGLKDSHGGDIDEWPKEVPTAREFPNYLLFHTQQ